MRNQDLIVRLFFISAMSFKTVYALAIFLSLVFSGASRGQPSTTGVSSSQAIYDRYHKDNDARQKVPSLFQHVYMGIHDPEFLQTELPQYSKTTLEVSNRVHFIRDVGRWGVLATAFEISSTLPREEILNWYVNSRYWGRNCFWLSDASNLYFGKDPESLKLSEVVFLVGLIKAPTAFDPERNLDRFLGHRDHFIRRLRATGWFSEEELSIAGSEPLEFRSPLGKCDRPRIR